MVAGVAGAAGRIRLGNRLPGDVAPVEHVHGDGARAGASAGIRLGHAPVMKLKFGFVKVRYRGLQKKANRLFTTCALVNLFLMRKQLLCMTAG